SYSLFIMGIANWTATVDNIKKKHIYYKIGLYFAIPGLLVTFLVRRLVLPIIPELVFENEMISVSKGSAIMLVFSILIFITAIKTLKGQNRPEHASIQFSSIKSMLQGAGIGLVTGFAGAGGGFLIVPALYFGSRMPMRESIATSLFIISITT